mgnify:CR=1 FL=1
MVNPQDWTTFEKVGLSLNLILFIASVAELTNLINLLPMYIYIFVLWALSLSLWIHRRRLS